jgi:hypothetical protein
LHEPGPFDEESLALRSGHHRHGPGTHTPVRRVDVSQWHRVGVDRDLGRTQIDHDPMGIVVQEVTEHVATKSRDGGLIDSPGDGHFGEPLQFGKDRLGMA